MLRWVAERTVRWALGHVLAGRPERLGPLLAGDVRLVFPGTSSFAADCRGREEVGAWMRRFASLHPDYEILDVVASGPAWNMRVAARFRDRIGDDYANDGMQYLRARWGRIVLDQVFLDTEAVSRWEGRHPELAGAT